MCCYLPVSVAVALQLKGWKNIHLIQIGSSCKRSVDDAEESNAEESWKTLLRAAEIRNHQEILELSKSLSEGEVPFIHYHRKCRSIFTMKKLLDKLSQQSSNSQTQQEKVARRVSIQGSYIRAHLYFLWKAKIFQGYKESWAFSTMPRYACR